MPAARRSAASTSAGAADMGDAAAARAGRTRSQASSTAGRWVTRSDGAAAAGAADVGQQMRLGGGVQGAGRLVEDQHARVADDRPGHGQELALAERQAGAALAQHGLVALAAGGG